jgi:asparagine synthase (glutamine-hydrolysing)
VEVLSDKRAPLRELIDLSKVLDFIEKPSDYGKPFYGQLMAGPQLLAYLLQVNYWLSKYDIDFSADLG